MMNSSSSSYLDTGWLDRVAIAMAVICGIHCLVTPILLVILPILATTFWTSSNFHLWMLCFVLPTTAFATFSGWRKHKDRLVAALAISGLVLLVTATTWERTSAHDHSHSTAHASHDHSDSGESLGSCCTAEMGEKIDSGLLAGISFSLPVFLNLLGGVLLSVGHWRNFRLCRKRDCRCCG